MFGDNVGVVFDGEPATPDITIPSPAALGTTPVAAIPAPVESYPPPVMPQKPVMVKPVVPVQEAQVVEPEPAEETVKKPINSWLLAGCGCIVVILLLCIAVFVFIDQPWSSGGGLYCTMPFNIIFGAFGYCP